MLQPVNSVGAVGVNSDIAASELPLNYWSFVQNVRFYKQSAFKFLGHSEIFSGSPIAANFALNVSTTAQNFWLFASLAKVYVYDGSLYTNITRQTASADVNYNATAGKSWQGGVISGIPYLNNGVDIPQIWSPQTPATKLVALPNWPVTYTCGSLRSFKQFMIAMDITKGSSRYVSMVKWSHPADPGSVPTSWNETDPTKLAGESVKLSETDGFLIDGFTLRDIFILYKEDSVWGMQFLPNNTDVFRIYKIFNDDGIMAKNCAVEYTSGRHVVFGQNDIYTHDGQQKMSIIGSKIRDEIFSAIDGINYTKCCVVLNRTFREVWFCYPELTKVNLTRAMIWNYETNTVSFKNLNNLSYLAAGLVDLSTASDSWDSDAATWSSDTSQWDARLYNPTQRKIVLVSPLDSKVFLADTTNAENMIASQVVLERRGIGFPVRTNQPPDMSYKKSIRTIWPRIRGTSGGVVNVEFGYSEEYLDSVFWYPKQSYVIGTTKKIDAWGQGRLAAIRFSSDTIVHWELDGYEFEYELAGKF